jgi:hypothetical protein
MTTRCWFSLSILWLAACAPPAARGVHVQPVNAYRAYGEYHPASQDEAVVAKAAAANPEAATIRIFQEALPAGIVMHDGTLGVADGYAHRLIGKYAYSSGAELSKDVLVAMVKKMCMTTGANAALVVFQLIPNDHQDRAQAIEAVLVDLHETREPAPATTSP